MSNIYKIIIEWGRPKCAHAVHVPATLQRIKAHYQFISAFLSELNLAHLVYDITSQCSTRSYRMPMRCHNTNLHLFAVHNN